MPPINRPSSSTPFNPSPLNSGSSSTLQIDSAWSSLEAMFEKKLAEIKPKTPAQIKANGDSRNKTIVISGLLIILCVIMMYIGLIYIFKSDTGKEFTTSMMPVITAIISGILGYLSGERSAK